MPSGSIPHDSQRPQRDQRHETSANNSDSSYERALINATAAPFIVFPSAALLDRRLSPAQLRVLLAMCWHANRRHLVWCKQGTIAEELNIPRQWVTECINGLIALGYVEIVRKAYRGAENTAHRTNKYRIIWENAVDQNDPDDPDEDDPLHRHDGHASIGMMVMHHRHDGHAQNNTSEQYQEEQSSSEGSYLPNTLAQSAENAAAAPPAVTAPPARRTRESGFNSSALRRDPLYIALVACLNREPVTSREWWQWRTAVNDLHTAGVSAAEIPTAIKGFQLLWPKTPLTPLGLSNQWSLIREGKSHEQLQLAQRSRSHGENRAAEAERQRIIREQVRRETERAEAEWEANLRAGPGASGLLGRSEPADR